MLALLAFLLLIALAVLLFSIERSEATGEEAADEPESEEDAVSRALGVINYGLPEAAEQARKSLLSLGPSVAEELVARLVRVRRAPAGMPPRAELLMEGVLADCGLASYLAMRSRMEAVDVRHPAYPGFVRIVVRLGMPAIEQAVREPPAVASRIVDAAIARMWEPAIAYCAVSIEAFPRDPKRALARALAGATGSRPWSAAAGCLPPAVLHELVALPGVHREAALRELAARGEELSALDLAECAARGISVDSGSVRSGDEPAREVTWLARALRGTWEGSEPPDRVARVGTEVPAEEPVSDSAWLEWALARTDDPRVRERAVRIADAGGDLLGQALVVVSGFDSGTAYGIWSRWFRAGWPARCGSAWCAAMVARFGEAAARVVVESLREEEAARVALAVEALRFVNPDRQTEGLCRAVAALDRRRDAASAHSGSVARAIASASAQLDAGLAEQLGGDALPDARAGAAICVGRWNLAGLASEVVAAAVRSPGEPEVIRAVELLGAEAWAALDARAATEDERFEVSRCRQLCRQLAGQAEAGDARS